jgi:TolA-binding protein
MKKLILLFTIMLATTAAFSQSVMTLISRSEEFFTTMQQEKFKDAALFFDESVQAKVPAETLQQVWTDLNTSLESLSLQMLFKVKRRAILSLS